MSLPIGSTLRRRVNPCVSDGWERVVVTGSAAENCIGVRPVDQFAAGVEQRAGLNVTENELLETYDIESLALVEKADENEPRLSWWVS